MSMTAQEIKKHDAKLARLYKPVSADYGLKPCPFCGSFPASFKNPLWPTDGEKVTGFTLNLNAEQTEKLLKSLE